MDKLVRELKVGDSFFLIERFWKHTKDEAGGEVIVQNTRDGRYSSELVYAFISKHSSRIEWAPLKTIDIRRTNNLLINQSFSAKPSIPMLPDL